MKWTGTNIIAALGFALLFIVFIAGLAVGALFIFPQMSLFGMVSVNVNERDTEIVYCDEILKEAFAKGNIFIESSNCNIEVVMQVPNHEATIGVKEQATGIAFNSLSRTLIEWTQVLVDGEEYFKIKVLEPTGIITTSKPTTVYINLHDQSTTYNFILQNNNSKVTFSYGDKVKPDTDKMHIGNLVVHSAGSVTIPGYKSLDVENVVLKTNRTKFTCGAVVQNSVTVTGSNGSQSFTEIGGDVDVQGNGNVFKAESTGKVNFTNLNGSLSITKSSGRLDVTTATASITVGDVSGGVRMVTDSGNLSLTNITSGGLDFTATTTANVKVSRSLIGSVKIDNRGTGSINLSGVVGKVDIDSSKKGAGAINVSFAGGERHDVKILGYDGNIKVSNITGEANIQVRDPGSSGAAGKANITAYFNKVVGNSVIMAGAYVNSPSGMGKVTVYLNYGYNSFTLLVNNASSAWSYIDSSNGEKLAIGESKEIIGVGTASGQLTVTTPAEFRLY